jgi:glycosyltransferase involved in cell wall biosynthesis
VAFFTPLAPQRSGIADYSEELLPHLKSFLDIEVVAEDYNPKISRAASMFPVLSASDFQVRHDFDIAIYQIANSFDHHAYMVPSMKASPGVLVLHDCCLQYLALGLTARSGQMDALERLLSGRYGAQAQALARRLVLNIEDPNSIQFAQPFVEMSRAVIVHSNYALDFVRDCSAKPVAIAPMGVPIPESEPDVPALRNKYGCGPEDFILLSISTLSRTKRLDVLIRAFAQVRRLHAHAQLIIVGGGSLGNEARALVRALGVADAVRQTGWLPRDQYDNYIAIGDLILDVRHPSGGETSASLARAFAAGKPAILSAQQTFMEIPDDVAVKVPVDSNEVACIAACAIDFIQNPSRLRAAAHAARAYAETKCSLRASARLYSDFLLANINSPVDPAALEYFESSHRPFTRKLIGATYKATRVAYLYRRYGLADTWRRVREELAAAHA